MTNSDIQPATDTNSIPDKADSQDFAGRFREIISDPLNLMIARCPLAGSVVNGLVYLHNGIRVPVAGPYSYYGKFSQILALNRGVHEPLEEYVFQQTLKALGSAPVILELGAFWGHYSMWLLHAHPDGRAIMVEPNKNNFQAGLVNLRLNKLEAETLNGFIGKDAIQVDTLLSIRGLDHLDILHADIQGYELEMIQGAHNTLSEHRADYVFISTHSQDLHESVISELSSHGYRIEVACDVDSETTSFDGLVFASSPSANQIFEHFKPLGRTQILTQSPETLVQSLTDIRSNY